MNHKAGFVNIIGNPNVGKSSLLNALTGEKLSVINPKVQTTRHRIMGIVNSDDYQIVYSDLPGILKPSYMLQESMMKFVTTALSDADIILYMTDVNESGRENAFENETFEIIKKVNVPVLIVLNKVDLSSHEELETFIVKWNRLLPGKEIFPVSVLHRFNLDNLTARILELLPESPPYYDKDELTDKPVRFFISEIIRVRILSNYRKEIPYSTEVEIEEFQETDTLVRLRAVIYIERETQKGIIIGHKGEALKKTVTAARKDIEQFLNKKVFLETFVKVDKDWRNSQHRLKHFGYEG